MDISNPFVWIGLTLLAAFVSASAWYVVRFSSRKSIVIFIKGCWTQPSTDHRGRECGPESYYIETIHNGVARVPWKVYRKLMLHRYYRVVASQLAGLKIYRVTGISDRHEWAAANSSNFQQQLAAHRSQRRAAILGRRWNRDDATRRRPSSGSTG